MSEYLRPSSVAEACAALSDHPSWMVLAGGTDLLVSANHKSAPDGIIDLWRLPGSSGVILDGNSLRIGAGTTWLEVGREPLIAKHIPILAAAAREIGALQIQARGTIGGNVANSSPVGDSLPVLLALNASLELASIRGTRMIAYNDFCQGYRRTARAADELIVAIHIPMPDASARQCWRKVGTRRAQSISKVMGAAVIVLDGDRVVSARVALGAVADRPLRMTAVENAVAGLTLAAAAEAARAALSITPITDVRSNADYRLQVAQNIVARFFAP